MTKKDEKIARAHIESYERSRAYSLSDVYGRYSDAKAQAWNYCKGLYYKLNGFDGLRILSHNTMCFSVGFKFVDAETGVVKFAYITRDYDRFCEC